MYWFIKFLILWLLTLLCSLGWGQVRGRVTDSHGNALGAVTVSIQDTYIATSTNKEGFYEIKELPSSSVIVVVQRLGFETKKISLSGVQQPYKLDVTLQEEAYAIEEVVIRSAMNPADNLIKKAIANRNKNAEARDKFEADFYFKGSLTAINLPKKILGAKLEDDNQLLDSTGSGMLYLSETVSHLVVDKPNKMKETIVASKISGENQGFSFNRAEGTAFDLYDNYISLGMAKIISPIADQAFSYYKYKLLASWKEEDQLIYKIQVEAKRKSEPVVEGIVYIVEDSWEVYGLDFVLLGTSINQPVLDTLYLRQQYTYNNSDRLWSKQLQTLDFTAGIMGLRFKGHFTHSFTNYKYVDQFDKGTFGRISSEFNADANQKDAGYWEQMRKVPLIADEVRDYHRRDSLRLITSSPAYIDSIDRLRSRFRLQDVLLGYRYQNTPNKLTIRYSSPLSLSRTLFNTVQGWNFKAGLSATKGDSDIGRYYQAAVLFNYGLADKKLYTAGNVQLRFNTISYARLGLTGGSVLKQFNLDNPIPPEFNTVYSLFWGDNYMKLYRDDFLKATYKQYVHPNLEMVGSLGYFKRSNVFNETDYTFFSSNRPYTPNNPMDIDNTGVPAFVNHDLWKADLKATIYFNTQIDKKPNRIDYNHGMRYPVLQLGYSNAFAASYKGYSFQEITLGLRQDVTFGNKGILGYRLSTGTFLNADGIAFTDFKHFNGNRTHIGTSGRYLNSFLALPYYSHSTNKAYLELHAEHNFKGYLLNKIPGINKLQLQTVVGYHLLSTDKRKPYQEFSIGLDNVGWGKYRLFRVDYVRSVQGTGSPDALVVGIKLLNQQR